MKQGDIAAIIFVAVVGVGIAYFIADLTIGRPSNATEKVKTIAPISSEIESMPSATIFNDDAVNPTIEIEIGVNNKS